MKTQPEKPMKPEDGRESDSIMRLIWSMADTTWRMFTPPAIVVPLAIYADLHWHTKPWLTLLALPIGLTFSVLLVRKQLKETK